MRPASPLSCRARRARRRIRGWVAAAALASACLVAERADASIVERVVAVVGERPILLSELRHRARPHLIRIATQVQSPAQAAAAENETFRELLNRMIDERLEEQSADKARLTITPEEIDNGIRQVAAQNNLAPRDLLAEAKRSGLTEQDYRDEIRRQVLEGKLLNLRVRNRVRVTEQDARAAYEALVREQAAQSPVDLKILVLNVAPGSTQQQLQTRSALADELVRRARAGEDFCQLILEYSEEPSLKQTCGTRGPIPLQRLPPELQRAATTLRPGELAEPIFFRDPNGAQAILVVQLAAAQPTIPAFDQVKDQMMERAFVDAMDRQKREWLKELRRGVYIDVRL